ncbi:solute carrier organic anion transporter family member 2B1 isoform X1 [Bufo gargarizans]|uniref:solute carrier organic anion transporter family member 2B1 isoform X1 n=1 Tax=Bufo gargarizans TaxID=30331 RepID=UPI001CF3B96A|nr:solute carrier organic anion transporter family member 2B1 isoform X1 [Bufo gargarizans]XP_044142968.1 solute carrier organic anion transporter family member 2B1 isoform X1 [Bufo gargarizans]XP_044142969.1 solute carrier organic anion transporter family member 2B1 isoform X1 [Bufo gargarizans]XP_044142970.1 solute carrier organic anion transporter family member 2B1 isoform X1 [Bufo gargarizans]
MTATSQKICCENDAKTNKSCRNPFNNIKIFVVCHGLLQLSQLLLSGYLKSSISTIEKRFGLSSQTSGILASFNEIGNTVLIVFVSYFGSRVHRPRFIGCGALIVCLAGFIMCLPHFIMGQYEYDKSIASVYSNTTDICQSGLLSQSPSSDQCVANTQTDNKNVLSILFIGQILLGIGGVPIQPFGISYIDDYASKRNSPLYIGILFAVTVMGPGVAFILGSAMLRYYVDIDKFPASEIVLTPSDPRWIGAWWLGFIVAASVVALASIPYFFFPKEMTKQQVKHESADESKPGLMDAFKNNPDRSEPLSLAQFIRVFPKVLLRTLKNPIYILVVLAQANLSAMICGLATFMAKFLERQFSVTASLANLLIGSVNIPGAMAGIVLGGIIMKRFQLSSRQCGAMCVIGLFCCILIALPLLFLGCSTQQFASPHVDQGLSVGLWHNVTECSSECGCSESAFNPICGADGIEYISPCYAGCEGINFDYKENKVLNYTRCRCITSPGSGNSATPGSCGTSCYHLLLPFMILSCLAGTLASTSQTPSFMLILRSVNPAEKSLAIGIQFMLLRILAWLPGPVMFGSMIDSTCTLWGKKCGAKAACQYYNTDLLRQRYIGLQILFKIGALIFFIALFCVIRHKDKIKVEDEKKPETHKLNEKQENLKVVPSREHEMAA